MRRIIVIPAVVVGCLIVIWVGTVAAAQMPPQGLLAPTLTASAQSGQTNNETFLVTTDPIASQNLEDQASDCSLPSSYPPSIQQWCQAIELSAQQAGLPANLIAAVVLQESGGDPLAYSSSGAVGLMQVMPRDGRAADFMCINGPCFASRPTMAELQDPDFNLAYGSRMLANLYAKHGTYREALFRYGPMDMGYRYADLVLKIWENYQ
ncbi:MAG: lytic transglycosylase domain-containing protein [Brevefilum sp.]|nr:lytic transglycosylase domain-containing protein [Brevefilum sp.]